MIPVSATAAALARLAETRDPEAWSWLVETHGFTLYRSCLAVLGNRDLAEDAVQEVFLHLRQTVDRFHPQPEAPETQAVGWLKRVACTVALQLARSQAQYLETQNKTRVELRPSLGLLSFSNPLLLAANLGSGLMIGKRGAGSG